MSSSDFSHQDSFPETRCLAAPTGTGWAPATALTRCADGTYLVKRDGDDEFIKTAPWTGVTESELSFHDEQLWQEIFLAWFPDSKSVTSDQFFERLQTVFPRFSRDSFQKTWQDQCQEFFKNGEEQLSDQPLNCEQVYELVRLWNSSAQQIHTQLNSENRSFYYKMYMNKTRMGGRSPEDLPREVTVQDALNALGIQDEPVDKKLMQEYRCFEDRNGLRIPQVVLNLRCRQRFSERLQLFPNTLDFHECVPGNLIESKQPENSFLRTGMREKQNVDGDLAVCFLTEPYHCDRWFAVFDPEDQNARVYTQQFQFSEEDDEITCERWILVAPRFEFFIWDVTQTMIAWWTNSARPSVQNPNRDSDIDRNISNHLNSVGAWFRNSCRTNDIGYYLEPAQRN